MQDNVSALLAHGITELFMCSGTEHEFTEIAVNIWKPTNIWALVSAQN
jgi:hypothetical protein